MEGGQEKGRDGSEGGTNFWNFRWESTAGLTNCLQCSKEEKKWFSLSATNTYDLQIK